MNSKTKRIVCFVLAMVTVLGIALPALAATTTITNQDNPTDFFECLPLRTVTPCRWSII